jgi:hypothetical protein
MFFLISFIVNLLGVARRAWGRNDNACLAIEREMKDDPLLKVTMPQFTDDAMIKEVCQDTFEWKEGEVVRT